MTEQTSTLPNAYPTEADLASLIALRRELHRFPEVSGEEVETARRVQAVLADCGPTRLLTGLGGHGVAAVFDGVEPGPTILLRCELDALPIEETGETPHRSEIGGKAHSCGHDGHMAILLGVAHWLRETRPLRGRAILLFQPAEEDGSGAAKVIADPRFTDIAPDLAFALHNMPGVERGHAVVQAGVMNCASRGLKIVLKGRTAHASDPATGVSPMATVATLIPELAALGRGGTPEDPDFSLVTLTHATIGEPTFGVAPGTAELWATLRTQTDGPMSELVEQAEAIVANRARAAGLSAELTYHDVFSHCENAPEATDVLDAALTSAGVARGDWVLPMRASEDFGRFGAHAKSAMMLLGSGKDCPALHNPDYDFPDEIIGPGVRSFVEILRDQLC